MIGHYTDDMRNPVETTLTREALEARRSGAEETRNPEPRANALLRLHVLASGSKGNCSIVENLETGACIVIDCGISKSAFMARCAECGLDLTRVEAILVTHEHSDHTKGLGVLTRGLAKCGAHPALYASSVVHSASADLRAIEDAVDLRYFRNGDDLALAGMSVHVFPTSHDAAESFGFRFDCVRDPDRYSVQDSTRDCDRDYAQGSTRDCDRSSIHDSVLDRDGGTSRDSALDCDGGTSSSPVRDSMCDCARSSTSNFALDHVRDSIGFMTDTGVPTGESLEALQHCRVLAIEANHDLDMLANGPYPYYLKERIASERGHLSNVQSACLLDQLLCNETERVIGMHVSQNNNTYTLPQSALAAVLSQNDHPAFALVGYQSRPISVN